MGFVTGVPSNATIKAARSGRFKLDLSSPAFLCSLLFFLRRFTYPLELPPLLGWIITRCDCTLEDVTF